MTQKRPVVHEQRSLADHGLVPHGAVVQGADSWQRRAQAKMRARNPIAPNQADILPWNFYDVLSVGAAAAFPTTTNMFTVPDGNAGKTFEDTNLREGGKLQAPQWMDVHFIGFYFESNMNKGDIDSILQDSYFQFVIGDNKPYAEGKIFNYPGGGGLTGETTNSSTQWVVNGVASQQSMYDLRLPAGIRLGADANGAEIISDGMTGQTILQNQSFRVNVFATSFTTTAAVRMYCTLFGILSRGVQ